MQGSEKPRIDLLRNTPFLITVSLIIVVGIGALLIITIQRIQVKNEATRTRIVQLLVCYRETLRRHPDFDLRQYSAFLQSFEHMSMKKQNRNEAALIEMFKEVEHVTSTAVLGRSNNLEYKTFSPNGFRDFYDNHEYLDVSRITEPPPITGHEAADSRIVQIGLKRGYKLRAIAPKDQLVAVDGKELMPDAARAWTDMKRECSEAGISLGLVSGYRSIDRQREIFLSLFRSRSIREQDKEYTSEQIIKGDADHIIERILRENSIPGFSKHHTGYTLDIMDLTSGKEFTEFEDTAGFEWISSDNYRNAKRFGFIPSYPHGADMQGPQPEAWEYSWVGKDILLKSTNLSFSDASR